MSAPTGVDINSLVYVALREFDAYEAAGGGDISRGLVDAMEALRKVFTDAPVWTWTPSSGWTDGRYRKEGTGSFGRVSLHDEAMALYNAMTPKTATVADLDRIYLERTQPLEPLPRPMVLGDLYAYQQYGWHQFGWPMVPVEWWQ